MFKYRLFFVRFSSVGVLIAFMCSIPTLKSQTVKNDSTKTILLRPKLTPLETITGDTLNTSPSGKVELIERIGGGGEYPFTPEQDTAYYRALRLHTPTGTLAQLHARMFSGIWSEMHLQSRKNPWEIARQNLEIPADYYKPSAQDRALYAYNIAKSQEIPTGLGRTPGTGLQIPLSDIGAFLGLTEDVSPVLNYNVEYPMLVEVVIYSPQARVIAVIMKTKQYPGNYRLTWNGRDDKGQKMPSGDYVAEVRLGNERFVRKRIEIP